MAAESQMDDFAERVAQARLEERRRIAQDLHDDINQKVGLIALYLDRLKLRAKSGNAITEDDLHKVWERVDALSRDVRDVSERLRSDRLERFGLSNALRILCSEVGSALPARIRTDVRPVEARSEAALALYRVAQEALQNVVRHSRARSVTVRLQPLGERMMLEISDDGVGFDATSQSGGFGLTGMRERLEMVDGDLTVVSSAGNGTTIRAVAPSS